jgi:hypothetical protein
VTLSTQGTRVRDALRRNRALRAAVVARRHRGLRRDDLFLASYPRSGNTWIRFLLADLVTGKQASFQSVDEMLPNVGAHEGAPGLAGGRRLIKTHEAWRPEYHHGVYLIRDVRDVLISWYRVTRPDPDDLSDLDAFVSDFTTHRASPYGCWSDHVRSWQRASERGLPITVYRFEDLKADPARALRDVAAALEIPATDEQVEGALARNTPEEMRRLEQEGTDYLKRAVGHRSMGVRRGKVGGWRELLGEQHLRALEPLLAFNRELGYE